MVKRVILDNWDDIPLLKNYTELKDLFFTWLDYYFEISDSIEEALENAIRDAFPNAPDLVVSAAIEVIMLLLPV